MPIRATKRGSARAKAISGDYDVIICGASFAGLTVARELAATDARILVLDRYEIGERQTSACATPTVWLEALGLSSSIRQTFDSLVVHTPHTTKQIALPWTFSTFDYRTLCDLLWRQRSPKTIFDTAKVDGCTQANAQASHCEDTAAAQCNQTTVHTDRGDVSAPLVVDALGWRRILGSGANFQPPDAPLSRGLEVHPDGSSGDLEIWIDRKYVPAGYSWCFPAGTELRIGVGSFDPSFHVKQPTLDLTSDLDQSAVRFQGNFIPHKLRDGTENGIFFVGDSAGHCLPLTAEGIRTAFYFAQACGRELKAVVQAGQPRSVALTRYHDFCASHTKPFSWLLTMQRVVPRIPPRLLAKLIRTAAKPRIAYPAFNRYLAVARPPDGY